MISIVKELYANAKDHHFYNVQVKGKTVSFNSEAINQYYNLSGVEYDEYAKYYELIIQKLCQPGTTWKVREKVAMQFPQSNLSRYEKVWFALSVPN